MLGIKQSRDHVTNQSLYHDEEIDRWLVSFLFSIISGKFLGNSFSSFIYSLYFTMYVYFFYLDLNLFRDVQVLPMETYSTCQAWIDFGQLIKKAWLWLNKNFYYGWDTIFINFPILPSMKRKVSVVLKRLNKVENFLPRYHLYCKCRRVKVKD